MDRTGATWRRKRKQEKGLQRPSVEDHPMSIYGERLRGGIGPAHPTGWFRQWSAQRTLRRAPRWSAQRTLRGSPPRASFRVVDRTEKERHREPPTPEYCQPLCPAASEAKGAPPPRPPQRGKAS